MIDRRSINSIASKYQPIIKGMRDGDSIVLADGREANRFCVVGAGMSPRVWFSRKRQKDGTYRVWFSRVDETTLSHRVYAISCGYLNEVYVGMTSNVAHRWRAHRGEALRGRDAPLSRAIREFGHEAFKIKVEASYPDRKSALAHERGLIRFLTSSGQTPLNLMRGGRRIYSENTGTPLLDVTAREINGGGGLLAWSERNGLCPQAICAYLLGRASAPKQLSDFFIGKLT